MIPPPVLAGGDLAGGSAVAALVAVSLGLPLIGPPVAGRGTELAAELEPVATDSALELGSGDEATRGAEVTSAADGADTVGSATAASGGPLDRARRTALPPANTTASGIATIQMARRVRGVPTVLERMLEV